MHLPSPEQKLDRTRNKMVRELQQRYGIRDERILDAMRTIPRHRFIPAEHEVQADAYGDHPAPIGHGQTISQPYIVAYMTEKMNIQPGERVLEIGVGSGYQSALLAELGARVYSVEVVPELAQHAQAVLAAQGYTQVHVRIGDGYEGWPEEAPFDVLIGTCATGAVPAELVAQLDPEHGRGILPIGAMRQRLVTLHMANGQVHQNDDLTVRFVPMVHGAAPEETA